MDNLEFELKSLLKKNNISFNDDDKLRNLIALIPIRNFKPVDLLQGCYSSSAVRVSNYAVNSGGFTPSSAYSETQQAYNYTINTVGYEVNLPYGVQLQQNVNVKKDFNNIYIVAGRTLNNPINTNLMYNFLTKTFTYKSSLNSPRHDFASTFIDDNTFIINGGLQGRGNSVYVEAYYDDQLFYNVETNTYTDKAKMKKSRFYHAITNVNGKVVITYGHTEGAWLETQEVYDCESNTVQEIKKSKKTRFCHCANNFDNGVLISGGDSAMKDQEFFDLLSETFTTKKSFTKDTRRCANLKITQNKVLFMGGASEKFKQDIYIYSEDKFQE